MLIKDTFHFWSVSVLNLIVRKCSLYRFLTDFWSLELQKRHENQKKKLELEFAEMDQKRREFEKEKNEFEEMYRQWDARSGQNDKKKKQKPSLF